MVGKRKLSTHYDIPNSDEKDAAPVPLPVHLTHILAEATSATLQGDVRQTSRLVPVPASPRQHAVDNDLLLNPDLPPEMPSGETNGPVYEREGGLDSDGEEEEDEGRALRNSDDPLAQWVKYNRSECLQWLLFLEGRGDHRSYSVCWSCSVGKAEYRCRECMSGDKMVCKGCLLTQHQRLPLHRVEYWTGSSSKKKTLKDLDLRIQLGHWHGGPSKHVCVLPEPSAGDDFVIVDDHGVHLVNLDYCGSLGPNPHDIPIWEPCHEGLGLLSFESKMSSFEFYHSLARESDNSGLEPPPMLKHVGRGHDPSGILGTAPAECAVLCPACPHPNKNLPEDWKKAPEEKQFLYALFLAMDTNFRLKRKDVSTEQKEPELGDGWLFYCELQEYMAHIAKHWVKLQERSTCVAHDAVDKPDREVRGTASSGIGTVDCARHNMKRPLAVGDLQCGERYINIDYMFFRSIMGTELVRFYVSYDIASQWHINIWVRMSYYAEGIKMVKKEVFLVFLVPKFHLPAHIEACNLNYSFNLTPNVRQTDGEAPERSTGHPQRAFQRLELEENGRLRSYVTQAVPEKRALDDMERPLCAAGAAGGMEVDNVAVWTEVALTWEKEPKKPNPFEMLEKDNPLARNNDDVVEEMHVTEMVSMGLQLEENQRTLGFDMAAMGLHPTNTQQKTMVERTSKLRRKIDAWECDEGRMQLGHGLRPGVWVQDIRLWLPSAILRLAGAKRRELCPTEIQRHEFRLLRSSDKIDAINDKVRRAAAKYRVARLKEDVCPRPQSNIGDPTRQKATKALYRPQRKVQPISWIWLSQAKGEAGERQEMNEVLRLEWAKACGQSMRWQEEVDLLEDEMQHVLAFFAWRVACWTSWIGLRGLPQREGETVYATRQAVLHSELRDTFAAKWWELPELIRKGRAGEDVEDWEWEDELNEDEDDEDAEVPEEVTRPVKSTYMDI
ncbi:hypothetical protein DFH06DRAFT_1326765 [Mycena polygramma]|nr:hypothetical protein DFH06DRAFT_1326765 [Mycena polygramma]